MEHTNWVRGVLVTVVVLAIFTAAIPAMAAGGWDNLGQGVWVKSDGRGDVVEVRVDNDRDPNLDYWVLVSNGRPTWLGLDRSGSPRVDMWFFFYSTGAIHQLVDRDEDGRYELQRFDGQGDGRFEKSKYDVNGDGVADTWDWNHTLSAGASDAGLGIAMLDFIGDSITRSNEYNSGFDL